MYYDRSGALRSEAAPNKAVANDRRTAIEASLTTGTYVDPAESKVKFGPIAETWLESLRDLRASLG